MIIRLKPEASQSDADAVAARIAALGLTPWTVPGSDGLTIAALGDERLVAALDLTGDAMVEGVEPIPTPYKLASRQLHPAQSIVRIGSMAIGGPDFQVIAGPCAVESRDQARNTAIAVRAAGASAFRAGAYKPRTSPYAFAGHGPSALSILREIGDETGLAVVTEVMDSAEIDLVAAHADALQIGARNMQNYSLLRAVGKAGRPVVLKRGLSATVEELLLAAEYLLAAGNDQVVLVERGIRTFETATRNTLDLSAVPFIKQRSHLPVLVDPSHGTGLAALVPPMALAAAACGADGLLVEVHEDPGAALSDGPQSLDPEQFRALMTALGPVVRAVGRRFQDG